MLTSTAFPEDSDTGTGFVFAGAGTVVAGLMRLICLDRRQLEAEQRQQLLTSRQGSAATPGPPPPALAPTPSTEPSISAPQPEAYVVISLGPSNELQPMGSKPTARLT